MKGKNYESFKSLMEEKIYEKVQREERKNLLANVNDPQRLYNFFVKPLQNWRKSYICSVLAGSNLE